MASEHTMGPLDPRRDLIERLGFLAAMYGMGEKIAFGTDQQTALDAITRIEALEAELEAAYDNLANADARIERLDAEVERLREAARDLLAVAADAIKDGVPLYPDQVPELEALNRAALAEETQDERP